MAMVLCFVALFIFAVLGIFSAKYRALAREAFDCTLRKMTLRPCQSGLDERIKSSLVASTLLISPSLARVINRNFQILSLAFTVLFFASFAYSAVSVYNYWAVGNCNGPNSSEFCVFDAVLGKNPQKLVPVAPGVGPDLGNGTIALVGFGCFTCPFTQKTQAQLKSFLKTHPDVRLEFRAYPIPTPPGSTLAAQAAFCADDQGGFWKYYDELFALGEKSRSSLPDLALRQNLNTSAFSECLDSKESLKRVEKDVEAGKNAGIYGTPTFFIRNVTLVGPKSISQSEDALAGKAEPLPGIGGACPPPEGVNPTEPA